MLEYIVKTAVVGCVSKTGVVEYASNKLQDRMAEEVVDLISKADALKIARPIGKDLVDLTLT